MSFLTKRKPQSNRRCRRLCAEPLERRELMTIGLDGHYVSIVGTDAADVAKVWQEGDTLHVTLNSEQQDIAAQNIWAINFDAKGGADVFVNDTSIFSCAFGGAGDDTLVGGSGADIFYGDADNDTLIGRGGSDKLSGGTGSDALFGGIGDDTYYFDADRAMGFDRLFEGEGEGIDTLDFSATTGVAVSVNLGVATLQPVAPFMAGPVPATMVLLLNSASTFENVIGGGQGDALTGNVLANRLTGGGGNDTLSGGLGNDTYLFDCDSTLGRDTLVESGGSDRLDFSGTTTQTVAVDLGSTLVQTVNANLSLKLNSASAFEHVRGGQLADRIFGNSLANILEGGRGNDYLFGRMGDDVLYGDDGNDHLYAGGGFDDLYGNNGDDTLVGIDDDSADRLWGNSGADSFWCDYGAFPPDDTIFSDQVMDAAAGERIHVVRSFANGADRTLDGDNLIDPSGGSNLMDFSNHTLFAEAGPRPTDIDQGGLADCWLMAALGAAAKANPNSIRETVVDLGDGTYAVELGDQFYRVDGELPTVGPTNHTLSYAGLGGQGSIWVAIVEKAYAFYRTGAGSYASLEWGRSSEAFCAIGCTGAMTQSFSNASDAMNHIVNQLSTGKAVAVGMSGHAYQVESVNYAWVLRDGVAVYVPVSVVLRNPYAQDSNPNDGINNQLETVTGEQLASTLARIYSAWVA